MAVPSPMPPGAMPPGVPPPGGPPPGAPMSPPPMGMPTGMPPPMGGAPPGMGGPFSDPFSDVSEALPTQFQIVDAASRMLKKSIETGAFYRTPDVLEFLKGVVKDLDRIVSSYSSRHGVDISGSPMGDDAKIIEPEEEENEDEG